MRVIPDAKIAIPELPPHFVERAPLRAELDKLVQVGLVCAPAGFGKTLLLADWARRSTGIDVGWVNLDRDDNDPIRLWSAVLAAIRRCPSVPVDSRLNEEWEWPAAGQPEFLAELIQALANLPGQLRLVLDDVHDLTDPATEYGIETFVRNLPANLGVVLSSRFDPSVGLYRHRLSQRLLELRADRLRFSRTEARELLAGCGVDLTPARIDTLYRCTDGWVAGLRLAAVVLAETADAERYLEQFSGDERAVADYLVGEVLSCLPPDAVEFLKSTSVADPLPIKLAAQLSGRDDAGAVLDALERRTEMVRSTGPGRDTYRVQPLLRGYLLAELNRDGASNVARLHAVTARWAAAEERSNTAIEHAVRSDDPALLGELLRRFALPMLLTGEHRALRQALTATGAGRVAADPWLALVSAVVHWEVGDHATAERDGRGVCYRWPDDPPAELAVLRSLAARLGVLPEHRGRRAMDVVEAAPLEPAIDALARMARSMASLCDAEEACPALADLEVALGIARRNGLYYLELQCLVLSAAAAGGDQDFRRMRAVAEEALALATRHGWRSSIWALASSAMLAYTALLSAQPAEAEGLADDALARGAIAIPWLHFALRFVHAAALADLGDRTRGLAEMQQARAQLGDRALNRMPAAAAAWLEFEAALRPGHHVAARSVYDWLLHRAGDTAECQIMRAWTNAASGRHDLARRAVRRVLEGDPPPLLPQTLVDAWLQEAVLADRYGDRLAARQAVQAALTIAEPLDVMRPFVEAGPQVHGLVAERQLNAGRSTTFSRRVLAAGRQVKSCPPGLLSEREHAVMSLLPSLLSLDEVATELGVSVNTVKSHVRSIYNKLDVSSRRTAVLAAYEQGLIAPTQAG